MTSIAVLKPIVYQSLRRNEVQSKVSPGEVKKWMADPEKFRPMEAGAGSAEVTQRSTLALRDPGYVIEAYPHVFEPNDENTPTKYIAMFNRRVEKGQCFHRPALGCREFAAHFEAASEGERPIASDVPIGMMLYDIIFRPDGNRAVFFEAQLKQGVLDTRPEVAISDAALREEVLSCSYKR